jgi:AraC family transcriptional regulator, transcriptional activator of pobA
MAVLFQFDAVASYHQFNNNESLHPLVGVIDFNKAKPGSQAGYSYLSQSI